MRIAGRGRVDVVELDDRVVARITWQPGWRWSIDVKPIVGTEYCQSHHFAYAEQGRLRVQMSDGVELEVNAGEIFEIPPGHDAWVLGDEPFVSIDFEALRGFAKADPNNTRRTLATILMTDIVDSTARAVELGPGKWQETVRLHNQRAERVIDQYDGRLVKTTGDGVIALFDSAERAVRAGLEIGQLVGSLGIGVRAGIQTGEIELSAGDVRGVAVHATARMMALAGAGEVVVSGTVRDLLDGTGLELEDFGLHTLKGLPGERQLYKVSG
ncbi:MAG: adenylate/guanylate cyclase domain-containing protein [Candidatus Limnocylindrales bacterium]